MTDQPIPPADEQVLELCPNPWCEAGEREGDFSPAVRILSFGNYAVQCTSCQMAGPVRRSENEAIAAWNQRTRPPVVDGLTAILSHIERYEGQDRFVIAKWQLDALDALAMRPAPETTASDDVVEAAAWRMAEVIAKRHGSGHTAKDWMGEARREEARAALANLPKPTEQATSPAPDAVLLLMEAREQLNDVSAITGNVEWRAELGKLVDRIDAVLAPASTAEGEGK